MRVHPGKPLCTVLYSFDGRRSFWTAQAGMVLARAKRLATDPRATDIRIRIDGREYDPSEIQLDGRS